MTVIDTGALNAKTATDTNTVNLVYILYFVGFFTGITALIGVIIAYVNRAEGSELAQSHYKHQIRIFWRGVIFLGAAAVLYVVSAIVTMASIGASAYGFGYGSAPAGLGALGIGALVAILPWALTAFWAVWTIYRCVKGMAWVNKQRTI